MSKSTTLYNTITETLSGAYDTIASISPRKAVQGALLTTGLLTAANPSPLDAAAYRSKTQGKEQVVLTGAHAREFLTRAGHTNLLLDGTSLLFKKSLDVKYHKGNPQYDSLDRFLIHKLDGPQVPTLVRNFAEDLARDRLRAVTGKENVKVTLRHKRKRGGYALAKVIIERDSLKREYAAKGEKENGSLEDVVLEFPAESIRGFNLTNNTPAYDAAWNILYGTNKNNPGILTPGYVIKLQKEGKSIVVLRAALGALRADLNAYKAAADELIRGARKEDRDKLRSDARKAMPNDSDYQGAPGSQTPGPQAGTQGGPGTGSTSPKPRSPMKEKIAALQRKFGQSKPSTDPTSGTTPTTAPNVRVLPGLGKEGTKYALDDDEKRGGQGFFQRPEGVAVAFSFGALIHKWVAKPKEKIVYRKVVVDKTRPQPRIIEGLRGNNGVPSGSSRGRGDIGRRGRGGSSARARDATR